MRVKLRHAAFAVFVVGVLARGAAFAWHMLSSPFPLPAPLESPAPNRR